MTALDNYLAFVTLACGKENNVLHLIGCVNYAWPVTGSEASFQIWGSSEWQGFGTSFITVVEA